MVGTAEKLANLRATLASAGLETLVSNARVPLGFASADAVLKGGLARGALHEIYAATNSETSATAFAAGLAARVAGKKKILWIRQDFSAVEFGELSATGFLELGIDPSQLLLVCTAHADDAIKAASDALTCAALGALVIERFAAKPEASTAETRWLVRTAASSKEDENWGRPVFETDLVRNRHGRTGHWVMEWNCDEGLFRELAFGIAAHHRAVVSASGDR